MKKLNLKDIQKEELNMLIIITEFMKKNNINYYLYGGTMLGAIRHQGFIPWDDDIDIILTRPEYDKLIKILINSNNQIEKSIFAIGYELGNSLDWPFIKIINKQIVVESESKCDKNLWIDVFVYDGIPKNSKKFWKQVLFYRKLFLFKRNITFKYAPENEKTLNKIVRSILKIVLKPLSIKYILNKYIKICKKYNYDNSEYVYDNIWGFKQNRKIPKKLLENETYFFEGKKFNGFKKYDEVLRIIYGDYMKIPPESERCTHSFDAYKLEEYEMESEI